MSDEKETVEDGKTEGERKLNISGFYDSLGELLEAKLPPSEEIIFGGRRGQLSMLVSVTGLGKSTLMLNTAIMAAGGEEVLPLLPKPPRPIRTIVLDMEA